MSTLSWVTEDKAKAKDKIQRWRISLEGKQENFIEALRKWHMLAASKVKMSASEKKKKMNRNTYQKVEFDRPGERSPE